jgi:hypothetical protein
MVAACARAGANAVLVTLPVNYTGYVLGRGGRGGPPGNGRIPSAAEQEGMRLCEESRVPEALERFGAHTHSVEALVASAECLLRSGDYDEAREFIGRAIEEIPLGTARPSFNALIRETALRSELPLVDLETRLLEASPHGISGGEYFWDHLHMSCDGYLWAARQIDGVLEAAGLIPSAPGEPLAPPELEAILEKKGWKKIHSEVAAHGY